MSYTFNFKCPNCKREIRNVPADCIGKDANCKQCNAKLQIPNPTIVHVIIKEKIMVPAPAKPPPAETMKKTTYKESFAPATETSERPQSSGALLFIAWVVGFIVFVNVALFFVGFMNAASR